MLSEDGYKWKNDNIRTVYEDLEILSKFDF